MTSARRNGPRLAFAGAIACAGAGVMLFIAAASFDRKIGELTSATDTLRQKLQNGQPPGPPVDNLSAVIGQSSDWHLADLRIIFTEAEKHGLRIASTEVDRQDTAASPFTVRGVRLRFSGTYASAKALISSLLLAAPHAYLTELSFERPDAAAAKLDVGIRIAFVYSAAESPMTTHAGNRP